MAENYRRKETYYIVSRTEWNELQKELDNLRRREKRIVPLPDMTQVTLQDIKDVFSFCHESKSRIANVVELRHFSRYFLSQNTSLSLKKIAVMTNCCDHTTVIHSRDKLHSDIQIYEKIERRYSGFESRITDDIQNLINKKNGVNEPQESLVESLSA